MRAAHAEGTLSKYEPAWRKWLTWCSTKNEVCHCPANPFHVALYFNDLLLSNGKRGAIQSAFYAIRWGHVVAGYEPVTEHPFVELALEGALRLSNVSRNTKDPFTPDLVNQIVDYYSKDLNLKTCRFLVVCLLGFAGFFRISELLKVQLKDIKINQKHMEIYLDKSKTDQHREGNKVFISRTNNKSCPINMIERFFDIASFNIKEDLNAFLIPRIYNSKKKLSASKKLGISYSTVYDFFKDNMQPFQSEDESFGLHSLRSGGASAAANNGVSERLISKHGRWKSTKSRDGYIKDSKTNRLKISSNLGI